MRTARHIEIAKPSSSAFREMVPRPDFQKEFLAPQEREIGSSGRRRISERLHHILRVNDPFTLSQPKRLVLVGLHETG